MEIFPDWLWKMESAQQKRRSVENKPLGDNELFRIKISSSHLEKVPAYAIKPVAPLRQSVRGWFNYQR